MSLCKVNGMVGNIHDKCTYRGYGINSRNIYKSYSFVTSMKLYKVNTDDESKLHALCACKKSGSQSVVPSTLFSRISGILSLKFNFFSSDVNWILFSTER